MISRKQLAFILAPLVPSIFILIWLRQSNFRIIIFSLIFSILFSYIPSIIFGIPLVKFLERKNLLNAALFSLCGAFFGIVVFFIFGFVISRVLGSQNATAPMLGELIGGAFFGVSVAFPLSLIAGFPLVGAKK